METMEELKKAGAELIESGYGNLSKQAKLHVHAYMRGIQEGMKIAREESDKERRE